ncbi:translation initiation factor IF-2 [Salinispira pacifica]|uniref:Translation initiation factor IF-2 n=1 Tax=Salinispira pacifica TaxID=1307761 RepID=V5WHA8_9SPIO|nr:translation initiation factor IF-2 [Salinispira pacifica]AHC15188.1 Translation initiation factor 2 [Salinispira pacifica]
MAQDQEQEQKPKAELIKHRKENSAQKPAEKKASDQKKPKKKVVVKRKSSKTEASGSKEGKEAAEAKSAQVQKENVKKSADTGEAKKGSQKAGEGDAADTRKPEAKKSEAKKTDSKAPRSAGNLSKKPKGAESGDPKNAATKQGIVGGKYVGPRDKNRGKGDKPHRSFRSNKPSSGPGGPGGQGRPQSRDGGRGPNRGGPPPRGDNRGGPGRFNKKPGGGGFRGPGAAPAPMPPSGEQKQSSKKFYKSKKNDNYKRKEKHKEKEIHFNRKKPVQRTNPVPKSVDIMEVITVSELARKMNLKASDLIGKLMGMGMMVTINQQIDAETATILAAEYNCEVNIVSLYDETIIETEDDKDEDLRNRPPIVTVMGHVDHGKTKLLDAIRSTDVVADESGGITQHIGAYQVETKGGKITFLDTPGHEAFTLMRARGAQVTDIVILVVAANDGVMPQTIEAIRHAQDAKVPIVVAVNKVDLPEANIDRVKQQLADYKLLAEDWGGDTMFYEISALKREGINELLEGVLLQSEVLELNANHETRAEGKIIESKIDQGRGTVATVLIERGKMKVGDNFVAGVYPGRIRAMFNDRGQQVEEATPSMPVEIIGLSGIPDAGDPFQMTASERQARQVGDKRQELKKMEAAKNVKKITLDNLYDSIQQGSIQDLKIIIKGDVQGSVEAIQGALEKLSTPEIRLSVIHAGAGAINDSDINLASASNAIIVGFHVRPTSRAQILADQEKVEIRKYSIIYDVVEDIRSAMEGMLEPELKEEHMGTIEVRDTFKVPKVGVIAGAYVTNGLVRRNSIARLYREGVEIFSGKLSSLKRFKDDAKEVAQGYECGVGLENHNDIKVGDIIEVFQVKEIARKLGKTLVELEKEQAKEKKASSDDGEKE